MGDREKLGPIALDLMARSRVADLKADCAELSALTHDMMPGPHLLADLSADPNESRLQLLCLYLRERGKRRRLAELLAG
jgi:hypothetical protein